MIFNWNNLSNEASLLQSYTLINEDTCDVSIFVFDNELQSPVLVEHFKGSDLNKVYDFGPGPTDLYENITSIAFLQVAQFLSNYMDNFSNIHPSLSTPNWMTSLCSLNLAYVGNLCDEAIYTNYINLNTFTLINSLTISGSLNIDLLLSFDAIQSMNYMFHALNGNNDPIINGKILSLKSEALTPGFYNEYPKFNIINSKNV